MHIVKYQLFLRATALIIGLSVAALSSADNYYRWVGTDGVVHYGSRPPEGVTAELISTYGKSAPSNTDQVAEKKVVAENNYTEKQKEVLKARQAQCDQERQRLNSLKSSGSRIQMEQPDGTTRYLSADEVIKEIASSEKFVNQACN